MLERRTRKSRLSHIAAIYALGISVVAQAAMTALISSDVALLFGISLLSGKG